MGLPCFDVSAISDRIRTVQFQLKIIAHSKWIGPKLIIYKTSPIFQDDFLSVEIENGHPAVIVDLGSGPQRINSDMNVTLGNWYQFVVERTGKHVRLTIVEESPDRKEIRHVKEEVIPGNCRVVFPLLLRMNYVIDE